MLEQCHHFVRAELTHVTHASCTKVEGTTTPGKNRHYPTTDRTNSERHTAHHPKDQGPQRFN